MSMNLNPIVNGVRLLAPDFVRAFGQPDVLSAVNVKTSLGESRIDMLTFKFQRRLPRTTISAHYTLLGAYAYGGSWAARSGTGTPQSAMDPLGPGEWGPTGQDERHRLVATGIFDLPYGIQVSPVFQVASARPYTLTAGRTQAKVELPFEATLERVSPEGTHTPEGQIGQILEMCDSKSVAEVSAAVHLPIGVVRVLLGDLVELGHVRVQQTLTESSSFDERKDLIERTLRGLRAL